MDLTSIIQSAANLLMNDTFVIDGNTINCVFNTTSKKYGDKNYGYPSQDMVSLLFNTTDFPTIGNYKGKTITHKNQSFRIVDIVKGDYSTTIVCVDSKAL